MWSGRPGCAPRSIRGYLSRHHPPVPSKSEYKSSSSGPEPGASSVVLVDLKKVNTNDNNEEE